MLMAQSTPGAAEEVTGPHGSCGMTIVYDALTRVWTVTCDTIRRAVMRAVVEHLYTDRMPQVPAHRLVPLQRLANALSLTHLACECDRLRHLADRPATIGWKWLHGRGDAAAGLVAAVRHASDAGAAAATTAALDAATAARFAEDMRASHATALFADVDMELVAPADGAASAADGVACTRVLRVHRFVLCQYEYFDRLINGWSAASRADGAAPRVRIVDVDHAAFAHVVDYMYTGDVQALRADPTLCLAVVAAAARFCVADLVVTGQNIVAGALTRDNASDVLEFAEMHGLTRLVRLARVLARGAPDAAAAAAATTAAETPVVVAQASSA